MNRFFKPLRGALFPMVGLCLVAGFAPARAQSNDPLASKSITQVFAVQNNVFALTEGGRDYSWVNLFGPPVEIWTNESAWPWDGGAQGGAAWSRAASGSQARQSVIVFANYPSLDADSLRIARVAGLRYREEANPSRSDSLIFPDTGFSVASGAALTSISLRADTAVLGFGRFGLAYAPLAAETSSQLFADSVVTFRAFPAQSDTVVSLATCVWNRLCRADTVTVPAGGLDSVIAVAIDSASPDSVWMLIATGRGVRRGLWRGNVFPYVSLPDTSEPTVRAVYASPGRNLTWAFTSETFYFSDDHGATFRVPPAIAGLSATPSDLSGYSTTLAPQVAFKGDSTFINFNMDAIGIAVFRRDTLQGQVGQNNDGVLINANDSLDIGPGEGSLTGLAVAYSGSSPVLAVGATLRGLFHRRLDQPGKTFSNINRLRDIKAALAEVITYPTVLVAGPVDAPVYSRIGYRLKKDGKVTITVYNYAMEKVRTVVKNRPRRGGVARSESVGEDRWDGRDDNGRLVSVGLYYVLVESDQGEKAFGKVIAARGRR